MTIEEKRLFLKKDFLLMLPQLAATARPVWGKMNAQQMLEHLKDFFDVSAEKLVFPLSIPEEHLPKYREFLYSDKLFRENTKAPATVLGEEPLPLRTNSIEEALAQLEASVEDFFSYFDSAPSRTTVHPVFGPLNFTEWLMLHHKHVNHHLKQFNLIS